MKRLSIAVLTAALAATLMTGCGGYNAKENTIYILKNGKIVSTDVETYDEELYEDGELDAFVKNTIETFNATYGENAVKLKKLRVKNGMATITLEYESDAVYTTFNGIGLFMGSIAKSQEAGFKYDGDFVSVKDGQIELCGVDDFLGNDSYKVAIFQGSDIDVVIPGKILYVSAHYAHLEDKKLIHISGDVHMTMKESSESGTEETQTTENSTQDPAVTEGSEITGEGDGNDGGAITDDELLAVGTEQPDTQAEDGSSYFIDDNETGIKDAPVFVIYK